MAITDAQKYKLNTMMGPVAHDVQLGTLIEAAEEGGLGADSVDGSNIEDAAISVEHLDTGIVPSHVVKFAGTFTTVGGDATESITVTGAAATDIAIVVLHTAGATPRTILTAVAATNAITVVFSGDPSTDHVVRYVVLRAAA